MFHLKFQSNVLLVDVRGGGKFSLILFGKPFGTSKIMQYNFGGMRLIKKKKKSKYFLNYVAVYTISVKQLKSWTGYPCNYIKRLSRYYLYH